MMVTFDRIDTYGVLKPVAIKASIITPVEEHKDSTAEAPMVWVNYSETPQANRSMVVRCNVPLAVTMINAA